MSNNETNPETIPNNRILILSSYDSNYADIGLGQASCEKNKEYADLYGYAFKCDHEKLKSHYFFHKFIIIKELLQNYDYIFWIDADAFLVNHSKKIQDFIPKNDSTVFIVSKDSYYLNTGVFIIKNDIKSFQILDQIINVGPQLNHPFPDAYVLVKIFEQYPDLVHYITPQRLFNSYKYELVADRCPPNPDGEYTEGESFVLHFPGMPLKTRMNAYHKYNVKDMK